MATTFFLKRRETRTSHGPIPHPLRQLCISHLLVYDLCSDLFMIYVTLKHRVCYIGLINSLKSTTLIDKLVRNLITRYKKGHFNGKAYIKGHLATTANKRTTSSQLPETKRGRKVFNITLKNRQVGIIWSSKRLAQLDTLIHVENLFERYGYSKELKEA